MKTNIKVILIGMAILSGSANAGYVQGHANAGRANTGHNHGYTINTLSGYYSRLASERVYSENGKMYAVHKSLGELEVLSINGNIVKTNHSSTGHNFYLKAFKVIKGIEND